MGLIVTFLLGLFFLVGVLMVFVNKGTKKIEILSVSVALGTMLSLVLFDLVPEVIDHMKNTSLLWCLLFVVIGVVSLKVLDIFVPDHDHEHSTEHNCTDENLVHIGIVSLIAIVLHNIIEGMAVYSMVHNSLKTGILVAVGVGLHNIPMGMIIASAFQKETKKKKILYLLFASLSTFAGGLFMFFMETLISDFILGALISITLGMVLYIILFELIPHLLHSHNKKLAFGGVLLGVMIILISSLFE